MIPPALVQRKWALLAVALLPLTLVSLGFKEQIAQAARQASTTPPSTALPDGVYLYGNSSQPDQLLHNYVVFEQQNGKVIGAFYSPQSEFTCFAGTTQGTQLDVQAMAPEQPPYEVKAQLANLTAIPTAGPNDQRMLAMCKQETIALARD